MQAREAAWPSGQHFRCTEVSGPSAFTHPLSQQVPWKWAGLQPSGTLSLHTGPGSD